jgi:type IV pilus assembly protein PilB
MNIADRTLERLLHDSGAVSDTQIKDLKAEEATSGRSLQDLVLEGKLMSEKTLAERYADLIDVPFVEIDPKTVRPELLALIPEQVAHQYGAVVYRQAEDVNFIAMEDPEDIQAVEFLKKLLGTTTEVALATHDNIQKILGGGDVSDVDKKLDAVIQIQRDEDALEEQVSEADIKEDSPTAQTVNLLIEYAIRSGASDIHIEPNDDGVRVRYRIDGILKEANRLPRKVMAAVVSRIKILANLKIDERRVPQDGRFKTIINKHAYALRVSTLPVTDGEKVVMRILDESSTAPTPVQLGYWGHSLDVLNRAIVQPNGMLLVTGPTGSGKSTSLFSVLNILNKPTINISTVEDPVEYRVKGVNQTQVNPKAGMTFASGLRALLRQDPNVIMVGEIRDSETADLAVQAALTGHLVLSTLHTNNAATSLPRLLDMKIEPFLIASTVQAVVGQRLVRQLDKQTRESYSPTKTEVEAIARSFSLKSATDFKWLHQLEQLAVKAGLGGDTPLSTTETGIKTLYRPGVKADSLNPGDGYGGRMGIYEVIENSQTVQQLVVGNATADAIEAQAIKEGMITMQIDGLVKCLRGLTSIEEVLRVTRS